MMNWNHWNGGDCPVEIGTLVDVIHRDGEQHNGCEAGISGSSAEDWTHSDHPADIVFWREHDE